VANSIQEILELGGDVFKSEISKQFDKYNLNATGKTLNSIDPIVSGNLLTVQGSDYIQVLQDGRRPTSNNGNGELLAAIKEWIAAKGLSLNPYAVTKKIHKEGTRLYRGDDPRFKKPTDVLSEPSKKTITFIEKESTAFYTLKVTTTFVNVLNKTLV
jgi:hypothetical protein